MLGYIKDTCLYLIITDKHSAYIKLEDIETGLGQITTFVFTAMQGTCCHITRKKLIMDLHNSLP